MEVMTNNQKQSSTQTVEMIQDDWNLNGRGSNALILPGKKRIRTKVRDKKVSRRNKAMASPKISKSKQRKLQKLQEEEEKKKLLLSKSIRMLQKYKIRDEAYSILQSSGTIGQAETLREKCKLAVSQKAGLEVPENVSFFKKKEKKTSEDVLIRPSDQGKPIVCNGEGSSLMKQVEEDDLTLKKLIEKEHCDGSSHVKSLEKDINKVSPMMIVDDSKQHSLQTCSEFAIKSSMSVSAESDLSFSAISSATEASGSFAHEDVKKTILTSFTTDNQSDTSLQGANGANICPINLDSPQHYSCNKTVPFSFLVSDGSQEATLSLGGFFSKFSAAK